MSRGRSEDHWDEQLEDVGWARMHAILDKEMPQKKRRVFWMPWFGGIAASLVIAGLLLYFVSYNIHKVPKDMLALQEEESIETQSGGFTTGVDEGAGRDASVFGKQLDQLPSTDLTAAFSEGSSPAQNRKDTNSARIINKDSGHPVNRMRNPSVSTASTPAGDITEIEESAEGSIVLPKVENAGEDFTKSKLIEKEQGPGSLILLPSLEFAVDVEVRRDIKILTDTFLNRGSVEIQRISKGRFDFALGASMTSDIPLMTLGWDGGLNFRYRFSPKIAIQTGLFFWNIRSQRSFYSTKEANNRLNMDPNAWFLNASTRQSDSIQLIASTNHLNYIRIPVRFELLADHRFSPFIGFSRLWYTNMIGSANEQSLSFSQDVASPGNSGGFSSVNQIPRDLIRKSNWTIDVGFSYEITKHIVTDLTLSKGLKSYLNYNIQDKHFSQLHDHYRLTMYYRF